MGAAFLELLPEAIEASPNYESVGIAIIVGIIVLFLFEKVLQWYHCHDQATCDYHTFSGTVLFGDALHNFIDGIIIALGFVVGGVAVGIPTTIAVFLHEIPQEMGDFAVLSHAGYSRGKILFYNALTALTAVVGALVGYYLFGSIEAYVGIFIALAAGTFIYIAVSDLLPELRHEPGLKDIGHVIAIVLGVLIIWALGVYLPE
jgi:zinc and cadmium transporter